MVDGSGLENRRARKGTGGSNPSLSAMDFAENLLFGIDFETCICHSLKAVRRNAICGGEAPAPA